MAELIGNMVNAPSHPSWWAGLVSAGLDAMRHAFRLNNEESAAWDLVTGIVKSLVSGSSVS